MYPMSRTLKKEWEIMLNSLKDDFCILLYFYFTTYIDVFYNNIKEYIKNSADFNLFLDLLSTLLLY